MSKEKGIKLSIYQCTSCGLVQIIDSPVSYYKKVIRASGFSKEMKSFRKTQFKNFIKNYNLTGKQIIEIGCDFGEYLSVVNKYNINSYGIEYS